jgi:nitrile hydratase subunit beta
LNSVHDMGGMHGMGPIAPEPDEPVFHAEWEARVLALALAAPTRGGRYAMERIPGPEYLRMSYYERWLAGLCRSLVEQGLATVEEVESGRADPAAARGAPQIGAQAAARFLAEGGSYRREATAAPAFQPGDRVRARNLNPVGHTRLPRYVRGRAGVVHRHHGPQVYPDTPAADGPSSPQALYTVRFTARELWGPDASERDSVLVDLWEPYLERA